MNFKPRQYQVDAIEAGVNLFTDKKEKKNGILILPTGSGKSVVIANIAQALPGKTIVFQPSKEILAQNYAKYISYGYRAGIYSHSGGMKFIDTTTFATIGSVARKHHLFADVQNIIVDECHLVNPEDGMYFNFIKSMPKAKVLGLTATPYRLSANVDGSMLKFLTRTSPRIFNKVLYYVQNNVLFDNGFLAPLEYYRWNEIDRTKIETNSLGTDFTAASLRTYIRETGLVSKTIDKAQKILRKRRNLLVFCSLIEEAQKVSNGIPGSVVLIGETEQGLRDAILTQFKKGILRCVINVGVLTTGFDYPALEAVLIARSTMSLALYYQIIGRVMRPYTYPDGSKKVGWVVDLGGNIDFFGRIETMQIKKDEGGLYYISNNGRQLTNVALTKN